MICQICNKNLANILFTIIVNNEKKEIRICKKCAEEKGLTSPMGGIPFIIGEIIFGMAGEKIKEMGDSEISQKDITCETCGLTYKKFKTSGQLGCELCYDTFKDDLKIVLRRIHGNNTHITMKNQTFLSRKREISELKKKLEKAIKKEEFEKAAKIRDKIKYIEKNG